MLIIIFIIVGLLIWLSSYFMYNDIEGLAVAFGAIGGIVGIGWIIMFIFSIGTLSSNITIDERIEMYQEENEKIETDFEALIKNYMDWESETYEKFKTESSIVLITAYPELSSDEMVKSQLNIHLENNNEIKRLKGIKISVKEAKWWLYFGVN